MKAGFGRVDITPRAGVELAGFGPYLNRHSIGVRDRLWARAAAFRAGGSTAVIVSCDLLGVEKVIVERVRRIVQGEGGLPGSALMVCATHTHSGPATRGYTGWGQPDAPYLEILPGRIARACLEALGRLAVVETGYARVPCPGIGVNRVYDERPHSIDEALDESWRPARPELTDTDCEVVTFRSGGVLRGFLSCFGCHPVVCCAENRYIHGDFAGVATNVLERENPGSTGLFLQGASGDVNSCVVHEPEKESLAALEVIAGRFAASVREGFRLARPLEVDGVASVSRQFVPSRRPMSLERMREELAGYERVFADEGASDDDRRLRMAVVCAHALRGMIEKINSGREAQLSPAVELQAVGLGPLAFFGAPFEVFQAIRNELLERSASRLPVLVSHANGSFGYAVSRDRAGSGDYADARVPFIKQSLPFAAIHEELVANFLDMERDLLG